MVVGFIILVGIMFTALFGVFVAEWGLDKPALAEICLAIVGVAFLGVAIYLPFLMMYAENL